MNELGLDTSVVEWVIECPLAARLFGALGIEYHCGGKSLEYACLQQRLDPNDVLSRLRRFLSASRSEGGGDSEGSS